MKDFARVGQATTATCGGNPYCHRSVLTVDELIDHSMIVHFQLYLQRGNFCFYNEDLWRLLIQRAAAAQTRTAHAALGKAGNGFP